MKSSAALLVAVLTAVSVIPVPLQRRAGAGTITKMAETTRFDAAGAVYCENQPYSCSKALLTDRL